MGEYENKYLNMKHYGLLPGLAKLLTYYSSYDKQPSTEQIPQEGEFRFFHKFMANNQVFLLSKDHPEHSKYCINEGLLDDIIHGRQTKIFQYNFTEEERQKAKQFKEFEEEMKRVLDFKGVGYTTQE